MSATPVFLAFMAELVDKAIDIVCDERGCPDCGAQTIFADSRSVDFPDGTVLIEVAHVCDKCGVMHVATLGRCRPAATH